MKNGRRALARGSMAMKLKRAGPFIKIVILALIVYAAISIVTTKGKIEQARLDVDAVQQQVNALSQENAGLEYSIKHAGDDETIESIARGKLGLVRPGEKIFYDVGN